MFIILLTYKTPLEEVDQYVNEHRAFLNSAYANNTFLMSGPKVPRTGGVIISNLSNKIQLEKILSQDPSYIAGIAEYEVIEFNSTKCHTELSSLLNIA